MDKKLFELNENTTPADSKRLAIGDASSGAENITLANFYNRLMTKLGFLKVANYFSEYSGNPTAQTTAQNNLDIYSKGQTDTAIGSKSNKSNVIEKDSTTPYTPTLGTHPVNLKVITDKFPASGTYQWAGGSMGDQVTTQQIAIGKTLPNTNYQVVFTKISGINSNVPSPQVSAKGLSTFNIECYANGGNGGNPTWDWYIIMR